jgi:uncharacterized membrane protein
LKTEQISIFTASEQKNIVDALKEAEKNTSGEIKVHVEAKCEPGDAMVRAKQIFDYLSLHTTALRNGVLIYLAFEDRKYAILGDIGIHQKVGPDFWNSTYAILKAGFANNKFEDTLIHAVTEAGRVLQKHFPIAHNDRNELSDDISFG